MKRDMDLCRELLFEIEASPITQLWDSSESPLSEKHGLEIVNEHVELLTKRVSSKATVRPITIVASLD